MRQRLSFLTLALVLSGVGSLATAQSPTANLLECSSEPGERQVCAADTSAGVVLVRSTGTAPCLLGKSWGYDDKSVWVSDGCSGAFLTGVAVPEGAAKARAKSPEYVPNAGFLLYEGENGQIYMRLFSYGEGQALQGTIDNMHRFRDGVLSRLG